MALRFLQLPEGKQSVFLRTTENKCAMPMQVKATPGFKLITNSASPQINVSYMKPGFENGRRVVLQQIKCPRRFQPVVVLNHPDADIPEVANIMKVVNRNKGAVTKVSLSHKTIQALSEQGALWKNSLTKGASSHSDDTRPRPVLSSVRERFLLKMKLRKKSKKKYEVVDPRPRCGQEPVVFDCWFCGRLFNNQEDWIGHGQRHLMEATRDWNKLF
ncbi:hypothetical protein F7725_005088 [Dissostichus mawsoni]|uniref:C2H2-type domain-containing protein n=1 Tax=Dissostichus mawsoni TaxID=36200 RepID=A0A7J5YRG2_DISMA|nr:hypothetical protein F7725_005088 [Dissostichus mawsoni]